MKKMVKLFTLVVCIFLLAGCSNATSATYVENKEMTLNFSYGDRTGIYTGNVEEGIPQGEGTFESVNDSNEKWTYTGDWKDGVMDGYGVCEWQNGGKYEGQYKAGYMDGNGSWYQDGELIYSGIFEEGRIVALDRKKIEIPENEPLQYVKLKTVGFQIPETWIYEYVNDAAVSINIPEIENVGIVYSVSEDMDLKDESVCEGLKSYYINEYGKEYSEHRVVSESHAPGMVSEYNLHLTFYEGNMVTDVYCNAVSRNSGVYVLTLVEAGVSDDYSEAVMCIQNTMKDWNSIQADIAAMENEQEAETALQYLNDDVDWEGLESIAPKVTAEQIIKHSAPQEQIILVEGVIDNISEESFDLWMSYGETYYRNVEWNYDISLDGIKEGDVVEICIGTHSDGSLKQFDGILAIRKIDQDPVQDIINAYKETCPVIDYKMIMRNPENAYGTACKASGTVLQVVETKSYMQEFLLELEDGNLVYVTYYKDETADNVLENDELVVYGMFYMTETYTTLLGVEKTVPSLAVEYVDIG